MPAAPPRVFVCPGDGANWAIDEDRRHLATSLAGTVELVGSVTEAEVVHAPWWEPLMALPASAVAGKTVVCHMVAEPARCLGVPGFADALARVDRWIAGSRGGLAQLRALAPGAALVPYAVDTTCFAPEPAPQAAPTPHADAAREALARLHPGAYVVANFHRDSEGASIATGNPAPKLVKGPDVLVEVLAALREHGAPVVALLAGPRRHWVRGELERRGVPCLWAGPPPSESDDYPEAILPRHELAALYRLADLHLCTSRSEGGPHSVLEAAACGTPQLSTPVGLAPDVLSPECLVSDPASAIGLILEDIARGWLRRFAPVHRAAVLANHTVDHNRPRWRRVYAELRAGATTVAPRPGPGRTMPATATSLPPVTRQPGSAGPHVCLWNNFTPPPWGGGNQFMLALRGELLRQGCRVSMNGDYDPDEPPAGHILNSVQFPADAFERARERDRAGGHAPRILHRLDGPISLIRRTPESLELDARCQALNHRLASATVVQSWHTLAALKEIGFEPVRPVLIPNAPDPEIFGPGPAGGARAAAPPGPGRAISGPLRVIATSWSPGPGKGAAVYAWMDRHLDPERYQLTFVGNCPVAFTRWRSVPPQASAPLAALLREHDVYLTASRDDPCSNALLEALACGLPALYFDGGGHPELVRFGGLPFRHAHEIPALLDRLAARLPFYRSLIAVEPISRIARRYLDALLG
ncbi:MAG TPA: glycosyltransferase [Phycisphaerales bacterium]|nr:glycosyltransferase [Phycisphaerales bacterium]